MGADGSIGTVVEGQRIQSTISSPGPLSAAQRPRRAWAAGPLQARRVPHYRHVDRARTGREHSGLDRGFAQPFQCELVFGIHQSCDFSCDRLFHLSAEQRKVDLRCELGVEQAPGRVRFKAHRPHDRSRDPVDHCVQASTEIAPAFGTAGGGW
jgi:hypothetical protein